MELIAIEREDGSRAVCHKTSRREAARSARLVATWIAEIWCGGHVRKEQQIGAETGGSGIKVGAPRGAP